jgi:hypothetical protein
VFLIAVMWGVAVLVIPIYAKFHSPTEEPMFESIYEIACSVLDCLELSSTRVVAIWLEIFLFGIAFSLLYAAARVYLVVECFINLAHLPEAAYQQPRWSQYIAHVGAG